MIAKQSPSGDAAGFLHLSHRLASNAQSRLRRCWAPAERAASSWQRDEMRMGAKIICIAANSSSSLICQPRCPGELCTDTSLVFLHSSPFARTHLFSSWEKDFPNSCLFLPRRDIIKSSICRQADLFTCPNWQN